MTWKINAIIAEKIFPLNKNEIPGNRIASKIIR